MTNGDLIRKMDNYKLSYVIMCPNEIGCLHENIECNSEKNCIECCKNWLDKERVKSVNNED